jgi:8-oxo-dGTP pyrophosphatase MutT (NUDIX family)
LPSGAGRKDLPAVESGRRELEEEAGLRGGEWLELFTLMASPGITTELAPCFVAWNLEETTPELAPEEELALRRIPFRDAVAAALDGTICDAASIATILALQARAL